MVDDPLMLDRAIRRDLGDRVEAWRRRAEPHQEGADLTATMTRNRERRHTIKNGGPGLSPGTLLANDERGDRAVPAYRPAGLRRLGC